MRCLKIASINPSAVNVEIDIAPIAPELGDASPEAQPRAFRSEEAYRRLKDGILTNTYPPGFTATEAEIAAQLSMSRTPLREALLRLEAEGLIQITPRHGL